MGPLLKNRTFILISAGMILPAAFLFSATSGLPHVFILAVLGFVISLTIRKPLPYSDRSLIYSVLACLILVVLLDLIFPMKQHRFYNIGKLLRANITVPLVIYLAVFATFYESTPYTLGFNAAFSLIVLMLGGDFYYKALPPIASEEMLAPLLSADHFLIFFFVTAGVVISMILLAFNIAGRSLFHQTFSGNSKWRKPAAYSASLLFTGLLAWGLFFTFTTYQPQLRTLENMMIRMRYSGTLTPATVIFSNEIDLNTTIRADRKENSNMILLRVTGTDTPPGYLRGRSYQFYSNGKWRKNPTLAENTKFRLNIDGLALNAFFLNKDPGQTGEMLTLYPARGCYADFLFLPGNTERIEMVADRVKCSVNGVFSPKTWEKDAGYTVRVPELDQRAVYPLPDNFVWKQYLSIPSNLLPVIDSTIQMNHLPGPSPVVDGKKSIPPIETLKNLNLSDREIINKLTSFFQNNFTYTLTPEIPERGREPLEFFLTETRSGHCELFAASAAMILRRYGIPTRYITGLVCHEKHPSGEYFVSRLGDAHAWVEAYLRDEHRWILVDATPSASADEMAPAEHWGWFSTLTDRISYIFQKTIADIRRGYVARAVVTAVTELSVFFIDVISHPVGGTLFTLSLIILLWHYRFHRKNKHHLKLTLEADIISMQKKIRKLEKKIRRKTGIVRSKNMTIYEWGEKVRKVSDMEDEYLAKFAEVIERYHQIRFSTEPSEKGKKLFLNVLSEL